MKDLIENIIKNAIEGECELEQISYSKIADEVLKVVRKSLEENQKGQFEDDAGNICWYLDDLIIALSSNKENK